MESMTGGRVQKVRGVFGWFDPLSFCCLLVICWNPFRMLDEDTLGAVLFSEFFMVTLSWIATK